LRVSRPTTRDSSKRLLLVCDYDGGLLRSLLETLEHAGFRNRVVIRKGKRIDWCERSAKIISLPLSILSDELPVNLASIASLIAYLVLATLAGTIEVLRRKLDAILAVYAFPQGLVAIVVGRLTRRKVAILTDGGDIDIYLTKPVTRSIIVASLGKANAVTALNKSKSERLSSLGFEPKLCSTIGVNTSRFDYVPFQQKEKWQVLYTGRLAREKQLDVLIAACGRLHNDGKELKLFLAGDGPLRDEMTERVTRKGLTDTVTFLGQIPHSQIHQLYRKSAVFVLPSKREGVSVSLLEAMSSGCICVVSDISDNRDVIQDMFSGITFKVGDAEDLANKLRWVISNPPQLASISATARQVAEREHSLETVGNTLLQLVSKL
jgi:glycosyltransferase involved in cell wall biosynthesis